MASNLQELTHCLHLMQEDWSMTCGVFRSPLMQPTGHFRAQTVQPLHLSASMEIFSSAAHSWAGHFLSRMEQRYVIPN